jgi:nucleoside-diphosphate-sugar epimerase
VVYCAGSVRGGRYEDFVPANVDGVRCLTEVLGTWASPPPLLLISSLAASRPGLSDYALSKREGERVLEEQPGLCWCILRPPAVYGPGDVEMRPLLNLVRRGLALRPGPAGQRLSLIHVCDLADAVLAWAAKPDACRHQTFSIDDGHPGGYDWREIGQAVAGRRVRELPVPGALLRGAGALSGGLSRLLGRAPMLTAGKARELQQDRWVCDNSPFSARTGWQPRLGLEAGARTIFAETEGAGAR